MGAPVDMARIRAAEDTIAELLSRRPGLALRTAAFLASEPSTAELEDSMAENLGPPTQLRLDQDTLDRADALLPYIASKPELRAMGRVARTSVLRLALLRGLAALEAEAKAQALAPPVAPAAPAAAADGSRQLEEAPAPAKKATKKAKPLTGADLAGWRKGKGLSQRDAATALGVAQSSISEWSRRPDKELPEFLAEPLARVLEGQMPLFN